MLFQLIDILFKNYFKHIQMELTDFDEIFTFHPSGYETYHKLCLDIIKMTVPNGHLDMLDWFYQKGLFNKYDGALDEIFGLACRYQQKTILDWIFQNFPINKINPNYYVTPNSDDFYDYLWSHKLIPTQETVNLAAEYGNLPLIIWCASKDIYPDEQGFSSSMWEGRTTVSQWLVANRGFNINALGSRCKCSQG